MHTCHNAPVRMWAPAAPSTLLLQTPQVCFPPLLLDARKDTWPLSAEHHLAAIYVANLTHISPYEATQGMLRGAGAAGRGEGLLLQQP